uniref:[histone H3]-trimethyl-L-lysine(4) demethylase n=1 Tax=Steinernema glaseri TaxID=37863 RepID=A0A1I7Y7P4_9BILA
MALSGKFIRPPEAPVFSPTTHEFNNPLGYIRSILPEIKKYGICKIKSPSGFDPGFHLSYETSFLPREQYINELSVGHRSRLVFNEQLKAFWRCQGLTIWQPIDDCHLDFYLLRKTVDDVGGGKPLDKESALWEEVLQKLDCPKEFKDKLQSSYFDHVTPFLHFLHESGESQCQSDVSSPQKQRDEVENNTKIPTHVRVLDVKNPRKRRHSEQDLLNRAVPVPAKSLKKLLRTNDPEAGTSRERSASVACLKCGSSFEPFTKISEGGQFCKVCTLQAVRMINGKYGFDDADRTFTISDFADYNKNFMEELFAGGTNTPLDEIEQSYWKIVHNFLTAQMVYYGSDIKSDDKGSGFIRKTDDISGEDKDLKECYANHPWNLNNFAVHEDSLLKFVKQKVSGITVPWMYVGMCYSSFCWHVEDHWTYSINYQHRGATKVWYGVPGDSAEDFDKVVRDLCPEVAKKYPNLLHHMTTAVDPNVLIAAGVPVFTLHQNPGEYVITLPRAYHSGFNAGFNINEAVNFATADWLKFGTASVAHYSNVLRSCAFCVDELIVRVVRAVIDKTHKVTECVDLLSEFSKTCKNETDIRTNVKNMGVTKSKALIFELLEDDDRCCEQCKTTLFHSAVVCTTHNKQVCLNHVESLCKDVCEKKDLLLCYRYTITELRDMLRKLKKVCEPYRKWNSRVKEMNKEIDENRKPTLERAQTIFNEGVIKKYPMNSDALRLQGYIQDANRWTTKAYTHQSTSGRIRNVKRMTPSELEDIIKKMENASLRPSEDLLESAKERYKRAVLWRGKYVQLIREGIDSLGFEEFERRSKALEEEADMLFLNFDSFGMAHLREYMQLIQAAPSIKTLLNKITNWKEEGFALPLYFFDCGLDDDQISMMRMFDEPNENSDLITMSEMHDALRLLRNPKNSKELTELRDKLFEQLEKAKWAEDTCEIVFKEKRGVKDAWIVWRLVQPQSWLDSRWINRLRIELGCCRNMLAYCKKLTEGKDSEIETSYKYLRSLQQIFTYSAFLNEESPLLKVIINPRIDAIRMFMGEMWNLFSYDRGYYSFFEIVCGRQDLSELAEGKISKLSLSEHRSEEVFDCKWIYQYKLSRQMRRHMDLVYEPQVELLLRLRTSNSVRPIEETCQCGEKKLMSSVITCYLCRSIFHSICISWEPALTTLPEGIYLCQRCLRGKRPSLNVISHSLEKYQKKIGHTYEYQMIHWFVEYSVKVCEELKSALQSYTNSFDDMEETERLQRLIMKYLSLECHSLNVNKKLNKHPYFDRFWPLRELHTKVMNDTRSRHNNERNPLLEIYTNPFWPKQKGARRGEEAEDETDEYGAEEAEVPWCDDQQNPIARECSHDQCVKPFGENLSWVQCEGKCQKWYHYICAGVTIHSVHFSKQWRCDDCIRTAPKSRKRRFH